MAGGGGGAQVPTVPLEEFATGIGQSYYLCLLEMIEFEIKPSKNNK